MRVSNVRIEKPRPRAGLFVLEHPFYRFMRGIMAYQDRFTLTTKRFGRLVTIVVQRGKVKCTKKGKRTTIKISYEDSPVRKAKSPVI